MTGGEVRLVGLQDWEIARLHFCTYETKLLGFY